MSALKHAPRAGVPRAGQAAAARACLSLNHPRSRGGGTALRLTLVLILLAGAVWGVMRLASMTLLEASLLVGASLIPCVQSVHWLIARVAPAKFGTTGERGRVSSPDGTVHWSAVLRTELRELPRTLGGLLGLIATVFLGFVADPTVTLQAEPIICCALFGGVCGCRYWRLHGMTIGAIIGLAVVVVGAKVPAVGLLLMLDSQWWFAACCVPFGALFGGYLGDGGLQSRIGAESASPATVGASLTSARGQ